VFRVRIEGSIAGFLSISIACALMASTFGLLIAALGNSPATARGVTTLAVLMMVMLGGAWVPTFVSRVDAAADDGRAGAVGRRRARCDDLARHRPERRDSANPRAARVRAGVRGDCRDALSLGKKARTTPARRAVKSRMPKPRSRCSATRFACC
jgi:hypothetical protein